jgi:hypothetical protein
MQANLVSLVYQIELLPGEKLVLPETLIEGIGAGRWVITIQPLDTASPQTSIRDHTDFLNSYAPEDEGLYEDYPAR